MSKPSSPLLCILLGLALTLLTRVAIADTSTKPLPQVTLDIPWGGASFGPMSPEWEASAKKAATKGKGDHWYILRLKYASPKLVLRVLSKSIIEQPMGNIGKPTMTDEKKQASQLDIALFYAVHERNLVEARRLLESGANANMHSSHFVSLLDKAMDNDDFEMARLLLSHGADSSKALIPAAYHPHFNFITLLLEYGGDPNVKEPWDGTPLNGAIEEGRVDVVRALIDAGANVHSAGGDDGYSPLGQAAAGGNLDIVRLLINHGVGVNERDVDDRTALDIIDLTDGVGHSAEVQQAREAVREFLEYVGGTRFMAYRI